MSPLEVVIGTLFVFCHAIFRFNQRYKEPGKAWASTTKTRYVVGALAYACFVVLIYWCVLQIPGLLPPGITEKWPPAFQRPPLLTALVLTLLVPQVPGLRGLDGLMRDFFHRRANIPHEMRRLSAQLRDGRAYRVPWDLQDRVTVYLRQKGCRPKDVSFAEGGLPKHLLTRLTVLVLRIDDWQRDATFSAFFTDNQLEYQLLANRFAGVRSDMQTVLRMKKPVAGSAADRLRDELLADAKKLLSDICDFISRAVLQSAWKRSSREAQLYRLGFEAVSASPTPLGRPQIWNEIISLAGFLTLFVFAAFVSFSYLRGQDNLKKVLVLTALVPATQLVAVLAATLPRGWTSFRLVEQGQIPRNLAYAGMAAFAYLAAACMALAAMLLLDPALLNPDLLVAKTLAWSLLAPASAIAVAYSIDNGARWPRWREGLLTMLAFWIATFVVCVIVSVDGPLHAIGRFVITGAMGFWIGYWIPTKYRRATIPAGAAAVVAGRATMLPPNPVAQPPRLIYLQWNRGKEDEFETDDSHAIEPFEDADYSKA